MSLAVKGLSGPLSDLVVKLEPGLTFGRQGDVVVADGKASSLHARITRDEGGNWSIVDNSSKNGTRVNGERIDHAPLVIGSNFYIGDQGFEIVAFAEQPVTAPEPPAPAPASASASASATSAVDLPSSEVKKGRYWYDVLADYLETHQDRFTDRPKVVTALNPAMILDFARGLQVKTRWVLGYGPRKIGALEPRSSDLGAWGAARMLRNLSVHGRNCVSDGPQR